MTNDNAEWAEPAEPETSADEGGFPALAADNEGLRPLHPNYAKVIRVWALIIAVPILIVALIVEAAEVLFPGFVLLPVLLLLGLLVLRLPTRRYHARGYAMGDERLRVVRGLLFRSDAVVPFGRVQHIDLNRDPVERYYGLSTLTVHTAGSHNASVRLPGLLDEDARVMRETIRAHIGRESL
ncbi:PH domain-containing protein [Altererythrobacter sp. SALINAS58]|uniref:PH domain-containing protein n=1 Tax=Alteripontixanthobacter muriae TaxID=2705546 RepID=UPI001576BB30|nr:PH domain-containing protein [Alteripontixanthobacter muriae]NTZ43449.1 PH domain-containing protein [Alteripontixanthobacter muriae]